MSIRQKLLEDIAVLEALSYLTAWLNQETIGRLSSLRGTAESVPRSEVGAVRAEVRNEIGLLKRRTKCRVSDVEILRAAKGITSRGDGYIAVPKWLLHRWFGNYAASFPRWPHIPLHAHVIFDSDLAKASRPAVFVAEGEIFLDVKLMWARAREISNDGQTFRSRDPERQRELQSYLRLTVTATYQCLEAYLNGIAYDCFHAFHNKLGMEDHDLLAEWDSKKKRRRFVAFEKKILEYPAIYGRYLGLSIDFSAAPDALFLVGNGKDLRDSLTHQSPYLTPEAREPEKLAQMAAISMDVVEQALKSTVAYMREVELALGHNPARTAPWLKSLV